jgi:hypothetical protein
VRFKFQDAVRLFLCLAAGISERMLPALDSKADDLMSRPPATDATTRNLIVPLAKPVATPIAAPSPEEQAVG